MKKEELETIIDALDQATLALKFYLSTRQPKYLQVLENAVTNLHQLIKKKGGYHG